MLEVLVSLGLGFLILVAAERLLNAGHLRLEVSRKLPHFAAGLAVVTWPFFVNYRTIVAICIVELLIAFVVKELGYFKNIRSVNRLSWGEFCFPLGIILIILLGAPRWVFVLAVLHLAIADSAAALIGTKYGRHNSYRVFGQRKSMAGSAAFFMVSTVLIYTVLVVSPSNVINVSRIPLLLMPFATTLAENLGPYGIDNILVPLTVVLFLS